MVNFIKRGRNKIVKGVFITLAIILFMAPQQLETTTEKQEEEIEMQIQIAPMKLSVVGMGQQLNEVLEEKISYIELQEKMLTQSETQEETEATTELQAESTTQEEALAELEVKTHQIKYEYPNVERFKGEEYLLAQIIYCEVGNCSKEEMGWAGSVVINRARTGYRDFKNVNTIREVLYQGYGTKLQQYGTSTIQKIENGIVPSDAALEVAQGLLNGSIPCLDESVLGQIGVYPKWDVKVIDLPGATEYYWTPSDFEEYRNLR